MSHRVSSTINVFFKPGKSDPDDDFCYEMVTDDHGWEVDSHGNITPPPRKKVIQMRLHSDVNANFFGMRFALDQSAFPTGQREQPWFNDSDWQAFVPMAEKVEREITFVLDHQVSQVLYQLGVIYDDRIVWDDPRIYSDGSD